MSIDKLRKELKIMLSRLQDVEDEVPESCKDAVAAAIECLDEACAELNFELGQGTACESYAEVLAEMESEWRASRI